MAAKFKVNVANCSSPGDTRGSYLRSLRPMSGPNLLPSVSIDLWRGAKRSKLNRFAADHITESCQERGKLLRGFRHWTHRYIYNRLKLMAYERQHPSAPWLT